ncbi:HNH endonuclease [Paenibacillus sp. IHBB 3054]|uniref:HNH endonuclease n=1 Tax=Paenibacillus sp. IHBB 3054 TaxID=3425689 RepID=UPI003F673B02
MEPHRTFPKPQKQEKVKKYNSLGRGHQGRKPVPEHKQKLFENHRPGKSSASRAEFPAAVVKELIKESEGICQCCKAAPATTTHHVMPRGRRGRGVKANGLRLCGICHDIIQTDEEQLQYWISVHYDKFGEYFWYDEQDWEEHCQKLAGIERAERERAEQRHKLAPVVDLISTAAGRDLRANEWRFIEMMSVNELQTFTGLLTDSLNGYAAQGAFHPHDRFED